MSGRRIVPFFGAYEQKGKSAILSAAANKQLRIYSAVLLNRSGVQQDMGFAVRKANASSFLSSLLGGVALEAALQAGTPTTVITTTINDGFIAEADELFNLVGLTISQAQSGSPVFAFEYWDGSAWQALPDVIMTPDFTSLTDQLLVFSNPRDWARSANGRYSIRVKATTATGTAVQASDLWIGKFLFFQPAVTDKAMATLEFPLEHPQLLEQGEGLLPFFSVASAMNLVSAQYDFAG